MAEMTKTDVILVTLSSILLLTLYSEVKQQVEEEEQKAIVASVKLKNHSPYIQKRTSIDYTRHDIECLARNVYFEARGEKTVGQFAVAQVTINRVLAKRWGKSVCKVVYANKQFSWTTQEKLKSVTLKGKDWETAKLVAKASLEKGVRVKDLDKALFYHADFVNPRWRDDKSRIKEIGAHIFYTQAKGDSIKL